MSDNIILVIAANIDRPCRQAYIARLAIALVTGPVGERLSSGLQIRVHQFESGPGLQYFDQTDVYPAIPSTSYEFVGLSLWFADGTFFLQNKSTGPRTPRLHPEIRRAEK